MTQVQVPPCLHLNQQDAALLLSAQAHIGGKNCNSHMKKYVWQRRPDGVHILNFGKTWEKLVLAARAIAAIENPAEVVAVSGRAYGQRAVLKFGKYTGAQAIAGRFTPGNFTNYITRNYKEPRLVVVTDPRADSQAILEASYVSIPVIAFCDTEAPLTNVDIAIPFNTKSKNAVGLMWYLLCREVLRLRGVVPRHQPWDVMVDMFFYRDPEEAEKEAAEAARALEASKMAAVPGATFTSMDASEAQMAADWDGAVTEWAGEGVAEEAAGVGDDWAAE